LKGRTLFIAFVLSTSEPSDQEKLVLKRTARPSSFSTLLFIAAVFFASVVFATFDFAAFAPGEPPSPSSSFFPHRRRASSSCRSSSSSSSFFVLLRPSSSFFACPRRRCRRRPFAAAITAAAVSYALFITSSSFIPYVLLFALSPASSASSSPASSSPASSSPASYSVALLPPSPPAILPLPSTEGGIAGLKMVERQNRSSP